MKLVIVIDRRAGQMSVSGVRWLLLMDPMNHSKTYGHVSSQPSGGLADRWEPWENQNCIRLTSYLLSPRQLLKTPLEKVRGAGPMGFEKEMPRGDSRSMQLRFFQSKVTDFLSLICTNVKTVLKPYGWMPYMVFLSSVLFHTSIDKGKKTSGESYFTL